MLSILLKYKSSIKRLILSSFIALSLLMLALVNDIYFRFIFSSYDRILRDIDHLLAGLIAPEIFLFTLGNDFKGKCICYISACFILESIQIFKHGYFQLDQFIFDCIGATIYYFFFNSMFNKKPVTI